MSTIVPPEDQDRIIGLYKRGLTIRQVAQEVHWGPTTVQAVLQLNRHRVHIRPARGIFRRITVEEELKRAQLYGRGLSIKEVADVCGVHHSAVRASLIRAGVAMRPQGRNLRFDRSRRDAV
jgi:AraC-like DNA-binding protein